MSDLKKQLPVDAQVVLDMPVNSEQNADTATETVTVEPSRNIVIRHLPHTVTITGHIVYKDSENSDDLKSRKDQNS